MLYWYKIPEEYSVCIRWNPSQSSKFHRKGRIPIVNRQRANEAVNLYIIVLWFPSTDLHNTFSCDKCEEILPTGGNRMRVIVMEGTEAGIFGNLSNFQRNEMTVPAVTGAAEYHYIMKTHTHRAFVDSISSIVTMD